MTRENAEFAALPERRSGRACKVSIMLSSGTRGEQAGIPGGHGGHTRCYGGDTAARDPPTINYVPRTDSIGETRYLSAGEATKRADVVDAGEKLMEQRLANLCLLTRTL